MLDSIKQKLEQINLIDKTKYKKAGVLIILLEDERDGEYKLLFTKRSSNLSTHSGEVSFPGGMQEEHDSSLYDTALRESNEEINLDLNNIEKLGRFNIQIFTFPCSDVEGTKISTPLPLEGLVQLNLLLMRSTPQLDLREFFLLRRECSLGLALKIRYSQPKVPAVEW